MEYKHNKKGTKVPYHLAVIPDGNRRWSREAGVPLSEGYAKGADNFLAIAEAAFASGVTYFTIWGASEDNLKKRSKAEIKVLTFLLKKEFRKMLDSGKLVKNKIRMHIVGNGLRIIKDAEVRRLARLLEEKTEHFHSRCLTLLFGYDGKTEMLDAVQKLCAEGASRVTYERVKAQLATAFLPPVDFVIRTGGEPHWSAGFLMWHTCDSEFYFPKVYWPAFHPKDLKEAFEEYATRRSLRGK